MYQLKVKGKIYCVESICKDGSFTKKSFGRCIQGSACQGICGTLKNLKNRRENSLHVRVLRRLRSIRNG